MPPCRNIDEADIGLAIDDGVGHCTGVPDDEVEVDAGVRGMKLLETGIDWLAKTLSVPRSIPPSLLSTNSDARALANSARIWMPVTPWPNLARLARTVGARHAGR